ncbi:ATP-binding protein [Actinoplanes sp. NPDC048791]|uniref:ATP-binding protein n=1 Tax=Actinoplanes sp. NPDC048791 TaxID=3154623 RepID=UPI00340FB26F
MSLLRTSPPPAQAVELEQWSLSHGDELRPLRLGLRDALSAHRLVDPAATDEVADRVVLVATELASNALRHGRPPAVVHLLRCDGRFLVDVADQDVAGVPQLAGIHLAGVGGRGLHIVRTLALDLCWYATATTKHIWASFPVTDAEL